MAVITIANEKGGIGKTTTAQHLATGLAKLGYKVLAIDMDSQRNLSSTFGDKGQDVKRVFDVLSGTSVKECIFDSKQGVYVIYGDDRMSGAERVFIDQDAPYLLKEALEEVKGVFDYIVIDTPPKSNSIAVTNAFTVSDEVIIPMQMNAFSIDGLKKIISTYEKTKKYTNPNIKILGILATMHEERTIFRKGMSAQMRDLSQRIGIDLFKTTIRKGVVVEECQALHTNLFDYEPKSKVANDYNNFVKEFIEKEKEI